MKEALAFDVEAFFCPLSVNRYPLSVNRNGVSFYTLIALCAGAKQTPLNSG